MLRDYGYVALLLLAAISFASAIPLLPLLLSRWGIVPRKPNPVKSSTYECGMETVGKTWVQFNFRYYFYALLFVALDILSVFLYPWAVNIRELRWSGFLAILIFLAIVIVGYIHAWRKKVLEWK